MNGEKTRQLAAIMFTDIVGYSKLTQKNEALTLEILKVHQGLIRSVIKEYDGSEIKTMGDAFLIKFPSAVEAVRCAIEIQKVVVEYNASTQSAKRFQVRVGVHLGDIVYKDHDVYGDGVNIASRIEPLAEPGGICISQQVYDQIQNKVKEPLEKLGTKKLKHIAKRVRIYKLILPWKEEWVSSGKFLSFLKTRRSRLVASVALMLFLAGGAGWWFMKQSSGDVNKVASSIAILPFKNLGDSKEDEYFTDGISGDILAKISKISELKVIAFESMKQYKVVEKSLRDIGKELGVSTVLVGSIRRSGNQMRIAARLVDAETDGYIWAESYNTEMSKVFDLQNDIVEKVIIALRAKISPEEKIQIAKNATDDPNAYTYYLRGMDFLRSRKKQDNENAIQMFKKAVASDTNFALSYACLAEGYCEKVRRFGYQSEWLDSSMIVVRKAISIDSSLSEAHTALALTYVLKSWYKEALASSERAVQLEPNNADAFALAAWATMSAGNYVAALQWINKALALRPFDAWLQHDMGEIYRRIGNSLKAEESFNKALQYQRDLIDAHFGLGFVYLTQGNYEKAVVSSENIFSINPGDVRGTIIVGFAELLVGNLTRAEELFSKAIGLKQNNRNLYNGRCLYTELGYIYSEEGQSEKAAEVLMKSWEINEKELREGSQDYGVLFDIMTIHVLRGDMVEAYTWLQKAIQAGWVDYQFALLDPILETLRNEEKFNQTISQVRDRMFELSERVAEMRTE